MCISAKRTLTLTSETVSENIFSVRWFPFDYYRLSSKPNCHSVTLFSKVRHREPSHQEATPWGVIFNFPFEG